MRLSDIMSEQVETIPPDAAVEAAREQMRQQDVHHLVVIDRGAIAGIVSDHDLRRAERTSAVRAVMSAPVVTAGPRTNLRQAANLLRGNHVSCLPVVDEDGRLIGMVTAADLLDLIGKGVTREPVDDHRPHRTWVPGR